jgi:hypothetical protein
MPRPLLLAFAIGLGASGAAAGCDAEERKPAFSAGATGGFGGLVVDASGGGPPAPDAGSLCGNEILPALTDLPNVYFVLDRSGSMRDPAPGSSLSKLDAARAALAAVLRKIGHRMRYGAAVFPMPGGAIDGCNPGAGVFALTAGDPPSASFDGGLGPVLEGFLTALALHPPAGGTPTAESLRALTPMLSSLSGKTVVVLATDGAPNCNPGATCSAADCQWTLEGGSIQGRQCTLAFNCCDPKLVPDGQLFCVDGDSTDAAIAELALAGIDTHVIGMPGSEYYAALLDRMAIAGNTPGYYSTANVDELQQTLFAIGVKVAITCSIELAAEPPDPKLVNVYLDTTPVPYDPIDGWSWLDGSSLELRGAACDRLMSGEVIQVQVVSGCPTLIR